MFCPACGQERSSAETIYCSRCGFLLSGAAELLATGGVIPTAEPSKGWRTPSPRNRGIKQGLFIFLLTFLIVPLIAIFTIAIRAEPYAVVVAAILLTVGGLLRMAYALMFESTDPVLVSPGQRQIQGSPSLADRSMHGQLPSQQTQPARSYVSPATGNWRDTSDLQPTSVVDGTTQLLEPSERDQ